MKRLIQTIFYITVVFLFGCDKEREDPTFIKITTGKSKYVVNSSIDVVLNNDLNKQATYLKCDNLDLFPVKILKKENGVWIENDYLVACTQMGPNSYIGVLDKAETKHDTVTLFNELGNFKLRYRFVADSDTLDFDSNEFLIYGLEDSN
ncbi:MAG: hypothetical protein IPO21_17885 [Bacteroidales bacterium]|nr:hypothetical protein [Bacteroidales bacterium]